MRKILLVSVLVLAALFGSAQSKDYPLSIGIGVNFPDFKGARSSFGEYLTDVYWEHKGPPIKVMFGYNLCPSFNLELSGNYAQGDNIAEPMINKNFWDIDLNLQYRFANGYLLKETSWWDPYLMIGPQVSHFNEDTYLSFDGGFGMNFWVVKHVALFGQAAYDATIDGPGYYHFGFGLKYRFNPAPDKDKDGIKDKKDKCPDVPGLPKFDGCPDTDGDGIPDISDACPKDAGLAQFQGCPDTDGDGIPDKDDACPQIAGLKEFKGCPDKDGAGIPDKDDLCPDVKGIQALKGCPDTDGDGITDAEDKCPNEKGPASNNGCPLPPPPPAFTYDLIIYYGTAQSVIPKTEKAKLDAAVLVMKEHPDMVFVVNGHTDAVGNDAFNMKLSETRVNTVVKYLVSKGVPAAKLESKAYGETTPAATNDTPEGKAKNRRVEIHVK